MKSSQNKLFSGSSKSIIIMLLACCCLYGVFFFPLWKIRLDAPQFPEGLELHIWVNKLSGSSKYIIQNINILNHYIGMKNIEPDSIPELKFFPLIIYIMSGLGAVFALVNRPAGFLAWAILMTLLSMAGVVDFILWLYDYGHNLDPMAPIQVPGESYMPPVFGGKKLLNFYATSYPSWGTAFLLFPILLSFLAYFVRKRALKNEI